MTKEQFEWTLTTLLEAGSKLSSKHEVEGLVLSVLKINESHPLFEAFVDKLCDKFGISKDTAHDDCVDALEDYISSLIGVYVKSIDESADTTSFAEDIILEYLKLNSLSMGKVKRVAQNNGFAINMKSVRPIINIIRKFYAE